MQASADQSLRDAVAALCADLASLPDFQKWFICLSGGADSRALMHLLQHHAPAFGATVTALIVNHNLRKEALSEAQMVAQWCDACGVKAEILSVSARAPTTGIQEWARTQRFALLEARARRQGGILWLGHHRTDLCETVAMRLSRNSGFAGLGAMGAVHYAQAVIRARPLLAHDGAALKAYCVRHQLAFIDDPSNENTQFERVRMRKMLQKNPGLEDKLGRLSHLSERIESALSDHLTPFWQTAVVPSDDLLSVSLCAAAFDALGQTAQLAVLRDILPAIGGQDHPPSFDATLRLITAIQDGKARTLSGCLVRHTDHMISILPEPGRGHQSLTLAAGEDLIYQGRLWVRAGQDCVLSQMQERHLAQMPDHNSYFMALQSKPKEVRMIFPYVSALDEAMITPHIKEVAKMGYRKHDDWPLEGVSIYPIGRLAQNV